MSRIGRRFVLQSTILRRMQAKDDRFARELRARDSSRSGEACNSGCGFCGRCDHGVQPNATCSDCGLDFSRASADVGTLCDACCDQRDAWASALELRLQAVA